MNRSREFAEKCTYPLFRPLFRPLNNSINRIRTGIGAPDRSDILVLGKEEFARRMTANLAQQKAVEELYQRTLVKLTALFAVNSLLNKSTPILTIKLYEYISGVSAAINEAIGIGSTRLDQQ